MRSDSTHGRTPVQAPSLQQPDPLDHCTASGVDVGDVFEEAVSYNVRMVDPNGRLLELSAPGRPGLWPEGGGRKPGRSGLGTLAGRR